VRGVEEEVEKLLERRSKLNGVVAYVGNISQYYGFFDLVKAILIAKKVQESYC